MIWMLLMVILHLGTVVFKVFGKVEHIGRVTGYSSVTKLYQNVYDNNDTEQYYHNEVRDQQKISLSLQETTMEEAQVSQDSSFTFEVCS